jgi:hypothetical protein
VGESPLFGLEIDLVSPTCWRIGWTTEAGIGRYTFAYVAPDANPEDFRAAITEAAMRLRAPSFSAFY